jgi:glycosyltransferase involved in cell wall biosynthesis
VRILIVTVPLPSADDLNTMAPLARQIASLRDLGVEVKVLEVRGVPKLKYLQTLPALQTHAASVDLVHAHYGYCGWLARCQFGKPVVVSFMGDDLLGTPDERGRIDPFSKLVVQIDRWFARTVDAVIVKSAEMAEWVKPVQAHVVPNGVDMHAFRPMDAQAARSQLGWPDRKRYVLFPGDPDNPRKQFSLAQAVVHRAAEQIEAPLELVPLERVAPDRVPLYMNACEVMVMTSLIEGSPNVVKEALSCNLPVVSVPVGDVPELLDGVRGYAVCLRDVNSLAEALVSALNNGYNVDGRSALRQKGLDLESVARKLVNIYTDVLDKRSRNGSKAP